VSRRPLPPFRISHRHIRLDSGPDATTWPWPFNGEHDSAAWKARYAPDRLTRDDLYELAGIANAYSTLITHPARSVRERLHVLHRIYAEQPDETAIATHDHGGSDEGA
jgi:hypothetical protein